MNTEYADKRRLLTSFGEDSNAVFYARKQVVRCKFLCKLRDCRHGNGNTVYENRWKRTDANIGFPSLKNSMQLKKEISKNNYYAIK